MAAWLLHFGDPVKPSAPWKNGARIAGASSLIYFCSRYDRPKANLRALVGDTMPSTSTPFARAEPALMLSAVFEGALRSEGGSGGKGCVSTCASGWWQDH